MPISHFLHISLEEWPPQPETHTGKAIHAVGALRGDTQDRLTIQRSGGHIKGAGDSALGTTFTAADKEDGGGSDSVEKCHRHVEGVDQGKDLHLPHGAAAHVLAG